MAKRTDIHRVSSIIPADYEYVFSYSLATSHDGWPVPSIGVNCELDRRVNTYSDDGKTLISCENGKHDVDGKCCVVGLLSIARVKFSKHGGTGKCSVCGANYIYGDVWKHIPTGEHIHIGHECADKYSLFANRSLYKSQKASAFLKAEREKRVAEKKAEREAFLTKNAGLEEALSIDHSISRDLNYKLTEWGSLTPAQVALAYKLYRESVNRASEPAEVKVPAPTGRVTYKGTVVSVKGVDTTFGYQTKITVKVTTEAGIYLVYSTAPNAIVGQGLRGSEVEITATVTRSDRDPSFAFGSRPIGKIIKQAEEIAA